MAHAPAQWQACALWRPARNGKASSGYTVGLRQPPRTRMDAERLNAIAKLISDLASRGDELRRYL